ncbi:MAG TPA: hypothetical protein VL371_18650 [Gemmataceae bacterium]|jgi:hypothetical protein|nr:hypothetical protein [Gemmataceae bacterium]
MTEEALAFVRVFVFVAGLATVYALARRWRWLIVSLAGIAALAGVALLGWAASQGIWAEPGRVHGASPAVVDAFHFGFPLTVLGAAVGIVALPPPNPSWGSGSAKAAGRDILVRMFLTWVVSFVVAIVVYAVVTGYVK